MTLKVVFDNILVKIVEDDSEIIISDEVNQPVKGKVITIGGGTINRPMQVHPGFVIYFNKEDAQKLEVAGETHYILPQTSILAYEED